jgi:hypothetical protein
MRVSSQVRGSIPRCRVSKDAPISSLLPMDFDVTTTIKNWASGTWGNYGFMLYPVNVAYPGWSSLQTTWFQSLEFWYATDERPQLIFEFQ